MKKLLSSPEVIAAMITVFGTLLVGIILGVAEGKIGFMSLLAVVASVVLLLLIYLLFKRSGPKVNGRGCGSHVGGWICRLLPSGAPPGA